MYSRNEEVYWLLLLEFFAPFLLICTYPFSICVCRSAVPFLGREPDHGGKGSEEDSDIDDMQYWSLEMACWKLACCTFFCLVPLTMRIHFEDVEMARCLLPYNTFFCYLTMMWFSFWRWQDGLLAAPLHGFESLNLDASKVVVLV